MIELPVRPQSPKLHRMFGLTPARQPWQRRVTAWLAAWGHYISAALSTTALLIWVFSK